MNLTFLSNTKIQTRLFIAFGIGIMLFLFFCFYAIFQVKHMRNLLERLHEHPMTVSNCSLKASESVIKMHRNMLLYVTTKDSVERIYALKEVDRLENDVYANLDYVKNQIEGAEGLTLEAEVRFLFENFQQIREEIIIEVHEKNYDKANELVLKEANNINELESKFNKLKDYSLHHAEYFIEQAQHNQLNTQMIMISMLCIIITLISGIAFVTSKSILEPLGYVKALLRKLARGEHPEDIKVNGKDEIAHMVLTVKNLVDGLKDTANFATQIGENKLDTDFKVLSEKDVLGNALIDMRQRLKEYADEEKKRQWSIEGIAKFADILRNNQENLEQLADTVIAEMIKYIDANQGAIFLLDNTKEEQVLNLIASYAWGKKKFMQQSFAIGQGLVGQCAQEQDTLFFTDVPENFIKIRSGLGEANPRCILIVPLKFNEELLGVIEIASFRVLQSFEVEFVEQLAENIAATVSILKINKRTVLLLKNEQESNQYNHHQEEILLQQREEILATQEAMEKDSKKQQQRIQALEAEIIELKNEIELLK